MATMVEMVEAHLANVQREIVNLQERKVTIDKEIERLTEYLNEGSATLAQTVNPPQAPAEASPQAVAAAAERRLPRRRQSCRAAPLP